MQPLDETHDPRRRSWVPGADDHADFPIQNLPHGVFAPRGGTQRGGIAIGPFILDLGAALRAGLLEGEAAEAASQPLLNTFLGMGREARQTVRRQVSTLLSADGPLARNAARQAGLLHPAEDCTLALPVRIGDFTDFYAGIHHATHTGALLRPDQPLTPNYLHMPLAYHGRASSVVVSGQPVPRPQGQRKPAREAVPSFGPSRNLDYELELGIWIGRGNRLGTTIPLAEAAEAIAGYCLLNDWSARDLQAWEAQPLGPFLSKSFCTTVSPWIVTPEALAPFRRAPMVQEQPPLPYLRNEADRAAGGLDIILEVLLSTERMRAEQAAPVRLARSNALELYWTAQQMVAHHASNGCNLQPGDLLGSGTISGATDGLGSMLELTRGGRQPFTLPNGETRRFLDAGDEIILVGRAVREGFVPIGLGSCSAIVTDGSSGADAR